MAGSSKDIIDSLIAKFHAMSDLCKAFENENGILKEQLMHQKQEMQALQEYPHMLLQIRFERGLGHLLKILQKLYLDSWK